MSFSKVLLSALAGVVFSSCALFKSTSKNKVVKSNPVISVAKGDSTKKIVDTIKKVMLYKEVITTKAVTDIGLFTVHRVAGRYFFEIPDSLLERDILIVSRIAKSAAGNRPLQGFLGYAGDEIGESIIRFSKGPDNKLFIKTISFTERSLDSSENGLYRTVHNSNLQPIVAAFDIKTYGLDSACVVDVTDYCNGDNNVLFFDASIKKQFDLGAVQTDKSYILAIESFPINVELQTVKTYVKGEGTATYELNTSIVMLPKDIMKPRYTDERVGYFNRSYIDFDAPQGVKLTSLITRWRLEPKEEDKEKYLRGELVAPKKSIVYYIDPATPKKWIPYLIQGVNDWQITFEKAGFKNAIYALETPANDLEFSLLDARHNAIIYKPSFVSNASGPHIHDPRTGEILETHVNWYHNVMELLHDWYMVQAGANDPKARRMVFDDSLMGQLIRFVVCHEVGHTLGLTHNFGASSTIPVDSLRSKNYVETNGFCPSIMDYARFNYVAQPEDGFTEKEIFPRIGLYDKWAIEWGYRWLPQLKTREEEKTYMNNWIITSLKKDKRLWYGQQYVFFVTDPRCQSEDLGDNAMKAGYYGIQNLKRVMLHLTEWTKKPNEDFESLKRMNNQVITQFQRYLMHVMNNIGLYTWTPKTVEQKGKVVNFVSKEKQKKAVEFLQEQLFETPLWITNKEIFSLVGGNGAFLPAILQDQVLSSLLNFDIYNRMFFFETENPQEAYTFNDLLNDLEKEIWKELKTKTPIDLYRRNLQKVYAERLIKIISANDPSTELRLRTDYFSILHAHIRNLLSGIDKALFLHKDEETRWHLISVRNRLKQALDPNAPILNLRPATLEEGNVLDRIKMDKQVFPWLQYGIGAESKKLITYQNCWEDNGMLEY